MTRTSLKQFIYLSVMSGVFVAAGCAEDKGSRRNSPNSAENFSRNATAVTKPADSGAPGGTEPNGGDSGNSTPTNPDATPPAAVVDTRGGGYVPVGGDSFSLTQRTKSWTGATTEPVTWATDAKMKAEVVGLFKNSAACRYRLGLRPAEGTGTEVYTDFRCAEFSCGQPKAECTTKDAEIRDVGPFVAASGKTSVCRSVIETPSATAGGPVTRTLIYTESTVWKHNSAIREDRVVMTDIKSCSTSLLATETAASVDACKPTDNRVSTVTRTQEEVTKQEKGGGAPALPFVDKALFNVSGEARNPSGKILPGIRCSMSGTTKLALTMTKTYCDGEKPKVQSLVLTVPLKRGTDITEGNAVFSSENLTFSGAACQYQLSADEGKNSISGTANCESKLDDSTNSSSVKINNLAFECESPANLDWSSLVGANPTPDPVGGGNSGGTTPAPTPTPTPTSATPAPNPTTTPTAAPGTSSNTATVYCASVTGLLQYTECVQSREIQSVRLVRRESIIRCFDEGDRWGFTGKALWVNRGCRAVFEITFKP